MACSLTSPHWSWRKSGGWSGFRQEGRLFAHVVIEECMLAANISAAKFLSHHKYPFLYRVHDKPEKIKVRRLQAVLREFGIKVGNLGKSRDMQKVMKSSSGSRRFVPCFFRPV